MSSFANKLKQALGRKPEPDNLCRTCQGQGQTPATRTEMRWQDDKLTTTAQGSGCPTCHGTGRLA